MVSSPKQPVMSVSRRAWVQFLPEHGILIISEFEDVLLEELELMYISYISSLRILPRVFLSDSALNVNLA